MKRLPVLLLALFLAFPARAVDICTCKPRDLKEDIYGSYAIFSGTVKGIRREFNPDRTRVEFNVHASWEKVKHKEYSVYTQGTDLVALAREGITCGYKFEQGKTYLVYAWRTTSDRGFPWVSQCGHTKLLTEAAEDMAILGKPLYSFEEPRTPPVQRDFSPTPLPLVAPLPTLEKPTNHDSRTTNHDDTTVPPEVLEQIMEPNDAVER